MPAALIGAGISAAGSVASSSSGKKGQKKAAKIAAQTAAQNRALAEQLYAQQVQAYQPSIDTGKKAMSTLNGLLYGNDPNAQASLDSFRNSGGYQTALTEGTRAIAANKGAAGGFLSGSTAKALQDRGNYLGQQTLGNYTNLLYGQQGIGQNALNALSGVASNTTSSIIGSNNSAGQAAGNAAINRGNATGSILGSLSGLASGILSSNTNQSSYNPQVSSGLANAGTYNLGGTPQAYEIGSQIPNLWAVNR